MVALSVLYCNRVFIYLPPLLVRILSDGRPSTVYVIVTLISMEPGRQKMFNLYLLNEFRTYTELIECACTQEEPNVGGHDYEIVGL